MLNHVKTEQSYSRQADDYEQKWSNYLSHTHQKFLNRFESKPGDRLLDLSAGTGLLADQIIEHDYPFSEFVLNDISRGMLGVARQKLQNHPDISFTNCRAENLEFKDASFESVISLNSFHHYADQLKALSEAYRVLKPGGKLYILDWNRTGFFRLVNLLIRFFTDEIIDTLSASEMQELLKNHYFQLVHQSEWRFLYWKLFLIVAQKT